MIVSNGLTENPDYYMYLLSLLSPSDKKKLHDRYNNLTRKPKFWVFVKEHVSVVLDK